MLLLLLVPAGLLLALYSGGLLLIGAAGLLLAYSPALGLDDARRG